MLNPYSILAGLLLVIAAYFGGAHFGAKVERAGWQKEKLAMQAEHEKQVKAEFHQYAEDVATHQRTARKASDNYDKALAAQAQTHRTVVADIRRTGGLRIPTPAACRQGPATAREAPGAIGLDEGTAVSIRLPLEIEANLFGLVGDADKVSEQLRALQGWVRANGFYGPAKE